MALRRTGRAGQSSQSFWRAPRRRIRRRAYPASTPPRDWVQIYITVLPSIIAAIALIFTWRTVTATYGQLQTTQQGQITDRYNAAITNLGSPAIDVRLGGIYAMQRIMQDSPRDQPTIVAVLCAFVRDHAKVATARSARPSAPPHASSAPSRPPADIQAALTVVGTRDTAYDGSETVIDFTGADLTGADLSGAHLRGADLSGADLSGANLIRADLISGHFSDADLSGANLYHADLISVDLSDANLTHARLAVADLSTADLSGAGLSRADLSEADLSGAGLSGADLSGASLLFAHLFDANLTHANLTGADLTGADLTGADLSGTKGLPAGILRPPGRSTPASSATTGLREARRPGFISY